MKIVAISDLHGEFPEITEPDFDILCICGDIFPLKMQTQIPLCELWLEDVFIPWCQELPCKYVLLVAGNHDFFFEREHIDVIHNVFLGTKIKYLENESFEFGDTVFYGTPYCHQFGRWAFMRDEETLDIIFGNIPEKVDVLLTHDAPFGTSDICLQDKPWMTGDHIGCPALRDAVIAKHPKILLHGHLHSTNHSVELLQDTEVYNVSVLDEDYSLKYSPLALEI